MILFRSVLLATPLLLAPSQDDGSATGSVHVAPADVGTVRTGSGPGSSPAPAPNVVEAEQLAYTGVDVEVELAAGLSLIAAGTVLLVTSRRQRRSRAR